MDVVRPFVGVDGFQILQVAHDLVFGLDAVAAVHVAGLAGDVEGFAGVVALDEGDHFRR